MLRAHFYHLLRRRRRHRSGAQIVLNAVTNAVKYTPPRAGVAITARLGPAASSLLVEVTDAGPGLRGQTLSQLVEENANPVMISRAYVASGNLEIARGNAAKAEQQFQFALSYSSPRTQHIALVGLAKVKLADAKRKSKGSRAPERDEVLRLLERAEALAERLKLNDRATEELAELLKDVHDLPFKTAV